MGLPIIMLHHVCDNPYESLAGWSISRNKFSLLLNAIDKKGFQTTTFEEIDTKQWSGSVLKDKVIITFDDCPKSLLDFALPELIDRHMKAVFFIPTAEIGGYNRWDVDSQGFEKVELMDQADLIKLSTLGMEIGSHGHHHKNGNLICAADFAVEIETSKSILEKIIHKKIYSLAYPYGEVPKNFKALLKDAGYRYGLSIYQSFTHHLSLRRIGIHESDDAKSIAFKLSRSYQFLRVFADPLLSIFKSSKA
ncbi:polysaccharide deacetylase family protein [Pedobacter frigidisoli]|uniref:Polysaccharide deacetylase family protein n=1 Tax=Pedobacter frigidisoli TaxID=2530455 RepID=A0A4V2MMQ0_9SPHI|nr:polysaccharide deacetylase family protein [Pedobacter frigidisoli]TCD07706.1 polysaccharide deacetylase family protein [Pedobacter frigidisoli]